MKRGHPMFPLGTVFVPGDAVSLRVFEDRYVAMVKDLLASDSASMEFGTVLIDKGSEVGGADRRRSVGVNVRVTQCEVSGTGGFLLVGVAIQRLEILKWRPDAPYPVAEVKPIEDPKSSVEAISRLARVAQLLRSLLVTMLEEAGSTARDDEHDAGEFLLDKYLPARVSSSLRQVAAGRLEPSEADGASWSVIRCVPCGPYDKYSLLEAPTLMERITRTEHVVNHLWEMAEFRRQ